MTWSAILITSSWLWQHFLLKLVEFTSWKYTITLHKIIIYFKKTLLLHKQISAMALQSLCWSFKCFYINFYLIVRCLEPGLVWFLIWFSNKTSVKTQIKLLLYTPLLHKVNCWNKERSGRCPHQIYLDNEPDFLWNWTLNTNH